MQYPLLIQGLFSNQQSTIQTLNPGILTAPRNWSNQVKIGRGDVILIDPVITNTTVNSSLFAGVFTYSIGGTQVFNVADNGRHIAAARPRSYDILPLRQGGGQTVNMSFINDAAVPCGIVMHHYFENKFATAEIIAARNYSVAKQRVQDFSFTTSTISKNLISPTFVVPKNLGNIVGLEIIVHGARPAATFQEVTKALVGLSISGVDVLENASAAIFTAQSSRPGLIFPILIRGGETFQIKADTSEMAATSQIRVTVRFYFDNDLSGSKNYGL